MSNYGRIVFLKKRCSFLNPTSLFMTPHVCFYDSLYAHLKGFWKWARGGFCKYTIYTKTPFVEAWRIDFCPPEGSICLAEIFTMLVFPLCCSNLEKSYVSWLLSFHPKPPTCEPPGKCFSRSDVSLYCNLNALKFACPAPARRNWHRNATRNWPSRLLRRTAKEHKLLTTWSRANLKFSSSLRRI